MMQLSLPQRIVRDISQLTKSLWLFFPALLFLLFAIFCFWVLGQGQDTITAFVKNEPDYGHTSSFRYNRLLFFVAIGFWVYVSWYSSRIIAYIKKTRQQKDIEDLSHVGRNISEQAYKEHEPFFEIGENFLNEFPRMIGNACFLILEIGVLQSPLLKSPISTTLAVAFFFGGLLILWYINKSISHKWLIRNVREERLFRIVFWMVLSIFIFLIILVSFLSLSIWMLFIVLLFFHLIFMYYTILRRVMIESDVESLNLIKKTWIRVKLEHLMDYFCIPRREYSYYKWFFYICIIGIVLYILGISWLGFSRGLGPFSFIFIAFGVLLTMGNLVTAFSVKYKINIHFLLVIIGLLFGLKETHYIHTVKLSGQNGYNKKPDLKTCLTAWISKRNILADSASPRCDMYFIMANGGASRSGYWTAAVLGTIEDASLRDTLPGRFSDQIFCLSGTSGGGVGVATFFSLLRDKENIQPLFAASAEAFLKQDYFTYTLARMLGPDYFNYIFHLSLSKDRGRALEHAFETTSLTKPEGLYTIPFNDNLSSFPALKNGLTNLPVLFINTTRMQDGNPGVVTNLLLNKQIFNTRIDVARLLDSTADISLTTGAILGARFPYLSPAGRIGDNYFVDGGYFDNSGAGVVQEMIRGIINIGKQDSTLRKQINKINFKVLHIVNSPVGFETVVKPVAPIRNDLMSPILTIVGAYDMQTTVNDGRLMNFIGDISRDSVNKADYQQISLYLTKAELKKNESEPAYPMNWFMSDYTRNRIDKRLNNNESIKSVVRNMK